MNDGSLHDRLVIYQSIGSSSVVSLVSIGVDRKKTELLGRLPNASHEWRRRGEPIAVEDHSFFVTGPHVAQAILLNSVILVSG